MQLLSNGSQVSTLPVPRAAVGAQGYFVNCNPETGELGSSLDADIMNAVIEEIRQVMAWGNQLPPNQMVFTQLRDAIVTGCNGLIQTALAALPPSAGGGGVPDGLAVLDYTGDGTGSFTVPAGVERLLVELWGGGGGANARNLDPGGAGGGGGYVLALLDVTPGQVIPYAVGAGGAGNLDAAVEIAGSGGATSFGALIAGGGGGGGLVGQSGQGGAGSLPPGLAGFAIAGQAGDDLASVGDQLTARGGNAPRGGSGGTAGSSPGGHGTIPGGGGGAMWHGAPHNWFTAGNGAAGRIVIYWGSAAGSGGAGGTDHPLLLTQQGGNIGGLIDLAGGVFSLSAPVTPGGGSGPAIATQAGGNVGGTIDFVNGTFSLTAPAGGGGSGAIPNVVSLPPMNEVSGNPNNGTWTWIVPSGVSVVLLELFAPSGEGARARIPVTPGQVVTFEIAATRSICLGVQVGAGDAFPPGIIGVKLSGVSTAAQALIWY